MTLLTAVIGKLGYSKVTFTIDSINHTGRHSCEAIYKFFSSYDENTNLLIFIPESLIVNLPDHSSQLDRLLRCPEEVKQQFYQKLEDLMPLIKKKNLYTVLIPSQGEYKSEDKTVKVIFENTVTNISSFMFSQLLLFLKKMNEKSLVVDISTGQNFYVISLLEAVRGILVYDKLNNILQGNGGISVKIAYSPPITSENQEVRIEFHPYDAKAFFELPIKDKVINLNKLIQLSYMDKQKYSEEAKRIYNKIKKLKMYLNIGRIAYYTIKYNSPLVFFNEKLSSKLSLFEKIKDFPMYLFYEVLNSLEEEHKEVQKNDGIIKVIRNYRINKDLFVNIHFYLALLNSIYKFWKQRIEGRDPTLEYIRQTFSDVYSMLRLELNSKFLERDCNEILTIVNNYQGDLTSPKLLEEIRGEQRDRKLEPSKLKLSDRKRNFFAHSGFSFDITKVSKRENDILLSYDSESFEREVLAWVKNPEG